LILTHGWPSTFYEFSKIVPLLTAPEAHGADAIDAFDVIVPSLPGYGFSDHPTEVGLSWRIPELWVGLMEGLGYERFAAHGGDIGGMVTNLLGLKYPERLIGIHTTYPAEPYWGQGESELSEHEHAFLAERPRGAEVEGAYAHLQRTRPQTLSYGVNDSPAGVAAWIVEKWRNWSDSGVDVESRFTKDELLTTIMIYWATQTNADYRVFVPDLLRLGFGFTSPRVVGSRST
jgi:pimeloyl-ACP methyl ester carboxylesterase